MSKRELNLSDKKLYNTTKEDIILKSPSRIPPKGIQDLIALKGINSLEVAHYDIALTEQQSITSEKAFYQIFYNQYLSSAEMDLIMGKI